MVTQFFLVLWAGLLSVLSPCILPVLPIILTGTEKDHKFRPLLIVAGLSAAFIAMGLITSLFSHLIGGRMQAIEKLAGVTIALLGVLMFLDVNPFEKLGFLQRIGNRSGGRYSGLLLGLTLGIIWIPCIGPVLSGVFAMVAGKELTGGMILLLAYCIGFSIPMLLAAYASQAFRKKISILQGYPRLIRYASGCILVVFGIFIMARGVTGLYW